LVHALTRYIKCPSFMRGSILPPRQARPFMPPLMAR